ncbi:MAG: hypothetical protein Q7S05_04275 [bacterium]|nr:hypothetical protein [bacterium]
MSDTALAEVEEKALVGLLYNHVSFGTTLQVFGEARDENARINTLRATLEKLLTKYELLGKLSPENLLMLGITNRVPREKLEEFAANENNKHLQLRAHYFLNKRKI